MMLPREDELARKYDALQDYLASQAKDKRQFTMTFTQIDQLVGQLPQTARIRRTWWANTVDDGREPKAWQAAGWHVQSVDLEAQTVVFARDSGAGTPISAGGLPAPGPRQPAQEAPGQEEGATKAHVPSTSEERTESRSGLSWRSIVGDLVVAGVAAAGTAACAIAGLMHLPLLAIALVTFSVAGIAATMSQAIVLRKVPAAAQTWWYISSALLILLGAGTLTYHEEFDPATTGPGLPFSAVVRVDPSGVIDQGCRTIVLPGLWHSPGAPPEPLTNAGVNQWQSAQQGIDGDETAIVVELQGISDQAVTIDPPQVVVDSRKNPVHGVAAQLSGGCGGELAHRVFAVDLDQQEPVATLEPGSPYPPSQAGGRLSQQAASPSFAVSADDPEYFVIIATTKKAFCKWFMNLSWQSMGKSGTLKLQNSGRPFETTAINGDPVHYLILGTWQ
jgi:hypothetical protein